MLGDTIMTCSWQEKKKTLLVGCIFRNLCIIIMEWLKFAISQFAFVLFCFFFLSRYCSWLKISRQIPSQLEVEGKPIVFLSHVSNRALCRHPIYHDWLKRVARFFLSKLGPDHQPQSIVPGLLAFSCAFKRLCLYGSLLWWNHKLLWHFCYLQ